MIGYREPRRLRSLQFVPLDGAACDGSTEQWTPERPPNKDTMDRLHQVCRRCPVITQCAALALQLNAGGYWAGTWIGDGPGAHARGRAQLKARHGATA